MAHGFEARRHADGALDLDHYRWKARRLRRAAQRGMWRRLLAVIGQAMGIGRPAPPRAAPATRAA